MHAPDGGHGASYQEGLLVQVALLSCQGQQHERGETQQHQGPHRSLGLLQGPKGDALAQLRWLHAAGCTHVGGAVSYAQVAEVSQGFFIALKVCTLRQKIQKLLNR